MPPLFSWSTDRGVEGAELDVLYPLLTLDRFGAEYRWQVMQVISFSGGATLDEKTKDSFTVFPLYFQQRSADSNLNYTALLPIYGHLKNRLLRDEIFVFLFPLYGQTRKRDVVTDNYLYPIFHLRHGDGLTGWQFWPLIGAEHKAVTTRADGFGDTRVIGGHEKFFALWPIFLKQHTGLGTENPERDFSVLPLFSTQRSPHRDSTTVLWPFFTATDDRERKYREWDAPWPLIVFARGEGKHGSRVWPLFSRMENDEHLNQFYLWPLYLSKRVNAPPLERERQRVLLFLYSDLVERNTDTGRALHRVDFWPLFTSRVDLEGRERLQILSILEPLLPASKSIERNWSPLWSLWRSEKNPATGAGSQSLLWNLYRRDTTPDCKKCSLLFGLFQYQSDPAGRRWRLFYIPMGRAPAPVSPAPNP
ncbi:MAG TPA: hypothetical protein VI454_16155 [Verrucomicrobiae bacterium]